MLISFTHVSQTCFLDRKKIEISHMMQLYRSGNLLLVKRVYKKALMEKESSTLGCLLVKVEILLDAFQISRTSQEAIKYLYSFRSESFS